MMILSYRQKFSFVGTVQLVSLIDSWETPLNHTLQNKLKYWFENLLNIAYFPDNKTHQDFVEGKCKEKIL